MHLRPAPGLDGRFPLLAGAALLAASGLASAQSFNLDLGDTAGPQPSRNHGAAASQPGTWNAVSSTTSGLVDVDDVVTTVQVVVPSSGNITSNEPCTSGDDEALMDDVLDPGNGSFEFQGLAPGEYAVYTYAMAPDSASYVTDVEVLGSPDPPQSVGGDFCQGQVQGVTFAVHRVQVTDGTIRIQVSISSSFSSVNGIQLVYESASGEAACFGDGSGGYPCACGNTGRPGEGCANSSGAGAVLSASGNAAVDDDTLVLRCTGAIPGQPGLFFQGDNVIGGGNGMPFGDGLRCCGSGVVRLETVVPDSHGDAQTSVSISARGAVAIGDTKCYQYWYRDPGSSPCGMGFNLSNGWQVTWN